MSLPVHQPTSTSIILGVVVVIRGCLAVRRRHVCADGVADRTQKLQPLVLVVVEALRARLDTFVVNHIDTFLCSSDGQAAGNSSDVRLTV